MKSSKLEKFRNKPFLIFVALSFFIALKAYSDLKNPYPLTHITYLDDKEIRKKTIVNKIPMSDEAVYVMNKTLTINDSDTELQKIAKINDFVRSKIKKGHSPSCDFSDWNEPIIKSDETFGDCSGYAKLFVMIANHFGIKSRVVWLFSHVSAEVFSNEFNKWIAVDVQNNVFLKNEKKEYISYVDFISLNLINPEENISPIQIGAKTLNDPTDLSYLKPDSFKRMLILDDYTIVNYCKMRSNVLKITSSYLGFETLGQGTIYSIHDFSVRHNTLFKI